MGDSRLGRTIAGLAGIAFVVVFVVVMVVSGGAPRYDDTPAEIREFFVDDDLMVHLTTWLGALATVFFLLPFAAGLRNVLAPVDELDGPFWSRLSFTGAVITVAVGGAGSAFWEALSHGVAEDLADETLVALARLDTVVFLGVIPWGLALFVAAASVAIARSGVLARWIGWLGLLTALLLVVGTLWIFAEDDEAFLTVFVIVGYPLVLLWVLLVSIAMLRTRGRPASATVA